METVRLRKIQQPSQVERLLDLLISRGSYLPQDSFQIRNAAELPAQLQVIVIRAKQEGRVWVCWASSLEMILFTCEMSLARSRERGSPVLLVNHYNEIGELKDSGSWITGPDGNWQRCAD
jgi:hypothetical protein